MEMTAEQSQNFRLRGLIITTNKNLIDVKSIHDLNNVYQTPKKNGSNI
jgi:hypothetical protein